MLTAHVERHISLRQTLGFKLRNTARRLQAFARFATARNDTHIRASTAVAWAAEAPSPSARHIRLRDVVHLARFLHAEASAHEVPPSALFPAPKVRPLPYIYAPEEVAQIVEAAGRLRRTYPSDARCTRRSSGSSPQRACAFRRRSICGSMTCSPTELC
jgi:integrase/recombinase XerD